MCRGDPDSTIATVVTDGVFPTCVGVILILRIVAAFLQGIPHMCRVIPELGVRV